MPKKSLTNVSNAIAEELFEAIRYGDVEKVGQILQDCKDEVLLTKSTNMYDEECIPLHIAVEGELPNVEIVNALLGRIPGQQVNVPDMFGRTPLALSREPAIKKILTENGADAKLVEEAQGNSTKVQKLFDSIAKYQTEITLELIEQADIKVLLSKGSYIHDSHLTLLHVVAKKGNVLILKKLLEKIPAKYINIANQHGDTPLTISANAEISEILIENGADLMHKTLQGFTALHTACRDEKKDVVELLVKKLPKEELNALNNFKATAISMLESGNQEIVEVLVRAGADIDYITEHKTPLLHAIDYLRMYLSNNVGKSENVQRHIKMLIALGANLEKGEETAMASAVSCQKDFDNEIKNFFKKYGKNLPKYEKSKPVEKFSQVIELLKVGAVVDAVMTGKVINKETAQLIAKEELKDLFVERILSLKQKLNLVEIKFAQYIDNLPFDLGKQIEEKIKALELLSSKKQTEENSNNNNDQQGKEEVELKLSFDGSNPKNEEHEVKIIADEMECTEQS